MSNVAAIRCVPQWATWCLIPGMASLGWLIFHVAPREVTMGESQRIVYLHVSVAWSGLAGCVLMGAAAGMYVLRRTPAWDQWSQASGEVGWLCTTLTLMTGSLWAHEAWNTWWTWEPRLTASLILWLVFAGYFLVRTSIDEPQRRARICAALAIVALADVPLVIMATRWFRGIHPVAPEMDSRMRWVLLATVFAFSLFFAALIVLRYRLLRVESHIEAAEGRAGIIH